MAITLTTDWLLKLTWNYQDTLDLSTIKDQDSEEWSVSLATGTGSNQCDRLWHDKRTLAAAATETLDLNALTGGSLPGAATLNFVKVKALAILLPHSGITTSASGEDLTVGAAASTPFVGPLGGTAPTLRVYSGSPLILINKLAGWATSGANNLKITSNGAGSIDFRIVVFGTSA